MQKKLVAIAGLTVLTAVASAETIYDNFGSWDGNITSGWFAQAQILAAPAVDDVLWEWRFEMAAGNTVGSIGFSVQTVAGGLPTGVMLYSDTAVVPPEGAVITFNNIGLQLTSGVDYAFVVDFNGYSGETIHYTGIDVVPGDGAWMDGGGNWFSFAGLDQKMYGRFDAVPEPASLLALGAGLAALALRRKR
ncbi:MAG: PEP-CTERM sorting domain-containing protein [Fimbriimonadales bacterium]